MGKLVLELREKLEKLEACTMLLAGLCVDDVFVGKVLNEFPLKEVRQNLKDTQVVAMSEDDVEKIAQFILLALKEIPAAKGMDDVKKARPFVEALTSLEFEYRNGEFVLDNYCTAINKMRAISYLILPDEKLKDPYKNDKTAERVDTVLVDADGNTQPIKRNFLTEHLAKANEWAEKIAKDGELPSITEPRDADMMACSKLIREKLTTDDSIDKRYKVRPDDFSLWAAEQIYGRRLEAVEVIESLVTDNKVVSKLFDQFVENVKPKDPREYLLILADMVDAEPELIASIKAMTFDDDEEEEKKQLPATTAAADGDGTGDKKDGKEKTDEKAGGG